MQKHKDLYFFGGVDLKKKLLPGITSLGIEISGRDEVLVCGCLGIGFYSPDEVKLNVPTGGLSITGEKLGLRWAGYGKLSVAGIITSVTYC